MPARLNADGRILRHPPSLLTPNGNCITSIPPHRSELNGHRASVSAERNQPVCRLAHRRRNSQQAAYVFPAQHLDLQEKRDYSAISSNPDESKLSPNHQPLSTELAMAFNQELADRISTVVDQWPQTEARKMFGGVGYLQSGHMVCGVHKDFLVLRLGPKAGQEALLSPHVKPFDITGRPMKGWVMVSSPGFSTARDLTAWLEKAREFVVTLPPK